MHNWVQHFGESIGWADIENELLVLDGPFSCLYDVYVDGGNIHVGSVYFLEDAKLLAETATVVA